MISKLIDRGQQEAFREKERRWASQALPPVVLGLGLVVFGGEIFLRLGLLQGALGVVAPFAAFGLGVTALTWAGLRRGGSIWWAAALYFTFALVVMLGSMAAGAADVYAPAATLAGALTLSLCLLCSFSPHPVILVLLSLSVYTLPAPVWAWLGGPEVPWGSINKPLVLAIMVGGVMGEMLRLRRRQVFNLGTSLRRQANEDPLTGLPNRAHAFGMGEIALKRARREGQPISLMLLDLDHFKAVNDTHGHPAGDGILQSVASLLRAEARAFDIIGRVGGEEFVWIMPGLRADECLARGAAFAARLRETSHKVPRGVVRVTASGGCVELSTQVQSLEAGIRGADEALHQAKTSGRDRLCAGETKLGEGRKSQRKPLRERVTERPSINREASYLALQFERTLRYLLWFALIRGSVAALGPASALARGGSLETLVGTHSLALGEAALFALATALIVAGFLGRRPFLVLTLLGAVYNLLLLGKIFDGPGGESAWFVMSTMGVILVSMSVSGWRVFLPFVLGKVLGTLPLFFLEVHLTLPPSMIALHCLWVIFAAILLYSVSEAAAYQRFWLIESLRGEATIDLLTGVFNRRRIMELAQGEMLRSREFQVPFTVLVLDIDHFKSINEAFGHAAGDKVLQMVADVLLDAGRLSDPAGRIGAEEFLLILPACDSQGGVGVAARIQERLASRSVALDGIQIPATLSMGIATVRPGEPFDALFRRGSEALARAKAEGQNRYVVSEEELPSARLSNLGSPLPAPSLA